MYYCRWLDDCDEAVNLIVDSKVQEHTQGWSINVILIRLGGWQWLSKNISFSGSNCQTQHPARHLIARQWFHRSCQSCLFTNYDPCLCRGMPL